MTRFSLPVTFLNGLLSISTTKLKDCFKGHLLGFEKENK